MTTRFIRNSLRAMPLAILLAATPALAQQPAPAAPANPAGGVSLAVTPPSEAHIAMARELVNHIGAERLIQAIVPNMVTRMMTSVTATRPELTNDMKTVMEQVRVEYDKQTGLVLSDAINVFVRAMTEQELRETTTFLRSPAGQKYLDTQGQSVAQISNMLEQWSKQISQSMFEQARAEMKKKGHDI